MTQQNTTSVWSIDKLVESNAVTTLFQYHFVNMITLMWESDQHMPYCECWSGDNLTE